MSKELSFLDQLLELHNRICRGNVSNGSEDKNIDENERTEIMKAKNKDKKENILRIRELSDGNKKTGT